MAKTVRDSLHLHPLRRARRAHPLLRRRARRACPTGLWGPWGPPGHARRARRSFSSDVPHRPEQPAPPYEPYYVPHGPHGVRRAVLARQEALADPGGAPARARRPRRLSEGGAYCPSCPRKVKIEKLRILPAIFLVVLYRNSPIESSSNLGQNSKKLNSY